MIFAPLPVCECAANTILLLCHKHTSTCDTAFLMPICAQFIKKKPYFTYACIEQLCIFPWHRQQIEESFIHRCRTFTVRQRRGWFYIFDVNQVNFWIAKSMCFGVKLLCMYYRSFQSFIIMSSIQRVKVSLQDFGKTWFQSFQQPVSLSLLTAYVPHRHRLHLQMTHPNISQMFILYMCNSLK